MMRETTARLAACPHGEAYRDFLFGAVDKDARRFIFDIEVGTFAPALYGEAIDARGQGFHPCLITGGLHE